VESIVKLFGINESLAAVTIVAFGNGAVEIFSAISNAERSQAIGDKTLFASLSTLLGGYMFAISNNAFLALREAPDKKVKLDRGFFSRDIIMMLVI
jgi:Ca2+/Na+ antiporter